jgi:hypothetical protein
MRRVSDPLERIKRTVKRDLKDYMGAHVFEGGCFFLNMLVELSGQSASMSRHILRGFVRLSRLMRSWLKEAHDKGMLKDGLNFKEIANFIVISVNGAAALYSSSRDPLIWRQTISQLHLYIDQLRQ